MSAFALEYPPGATPLDPDELAGLIPNFITTRGELNLLEQNNILEARSWALRNTHRDLPNEAFIRKLHKRMLGHVWRWAGEYRHTDKSIGAPWQDVGVGVRELCDNTRYWIANGTYSWDELGTRFHHRLVWLHPFPNGNGRHARLMTDVLLASNGQPPFTWGEEANLESGGETRAEYIAALREADQKKLERLMAFVKR